MRVLFTSWAWPSHYFPMVPLGWALRAAGHEVRVASQPALAEAITRSGLPAVVTGHDVDFPAILRRQLGDWSGRGATGAARREGSDGQARRLDPDQVRAWAIRGLEIFVPVVEAMIDELVAFGRQWRPDLIVYEPTTWAGPLAAAVLGIPAVRHLWGVDYTVQARELEPVVLAPVLERLGLAEVDTIGTVTIDTCPPSMQVAANYRRHLMRYIPYNGSGIAPGWLLAPPPRTRVCVTWGTSSARLAHLSPVGPVLDAVSQLDVEVVATLSATDIERLGTPPDGVRVLEQVPLHMLLPTCDLIVHQGGMGTTMTALTCGLPQLVIPRLPDQTFNAGRLAATGSGRAIPAGEADTTAIRAALPDLLGPGACRQAAERLRDEIASQPAPSDAVNMLLALAGQGAQAVAVTGSAG